MTFKGRLRTTTALAATLGLTVAILAQPALAATTEELEEKLRQLEAVVLQQQKTIEAQAEKLEAQEKKLEDQALKVESHGETLREQRIWASEQQQQIAGQGKLLYRMWETAKQDSTIPVSNSNGMAYNGTANGASGGARNGADDESRTEWIYAPDSRIFLAQESAPRPTPPVLDDEEEDAPTAPGATPPSEEPDQGGRPRPPVVEDEGGAPAPPVVQDEPPAAPSQQEERPRAPTTTVEEERPEAEKPREEALLDRGAILLPSGRMQLEPSIEYSRFSSDRIAISGLSIIEAILIGLIRVDDLQRDVINGSLSARLGVLDRLQLDMRVPGVYRQDTEVLGVGTPDVSERTINVVGIGDVSGGVSYQPIIGGGGVPDVIVRAGVTIPTGTHPFEIDTVRVGPGNELRLVEPPTGNGFYSVGGTATFVWSLDPVVFFTGGGYRWNMARDFGTGAGRIDPGDTIEFFAGANIALSERVSLSLSAVNQRTGSTTQNGNTSPGSSFDDARLTAGTSISLSSNMSLLVSASAGLTDTSPDYVFSVSLPITFDLF